jgi:hypothetical protein
MRPPEKLTIHPEKTKLVDFTKPGEDSRKGSGTIVLDRRT